MKNLADLIPDPSSLELREPDLSILGDLSKIDLISMDAEPDTISPFGTSVISWAVEDRDSRCSVRLNGVNVPLVGSMRVSPNTNFPYYLKAYNGMHTKDLGQVEVRVNTSACVIDTYPYVNQAFKTYLGIWAREVTGLRLRAHTQEAISVITSTGNIHFEIALEHVVDNMPNPRVDVRGDLGLQVLDDPLVMNRGRLHGFFRNLTIDAHYTFQQWLKAAAIPGGVVVAPIIIGAAKDMATNNINALFDRVLATRAVQGDPPIGMSIQNVALSAGADGMGQLRRTFCPSIPPVRPPRRRGR